MRQNPLLQTAREKVSGDNLISLAVAVILRDLDVESDLVTLRACLFDLPYIAAMDEEEFAKAVDFLRQENRAGRL